MNRCFTSESVTEGHPDKLCDQIADAVLDEILTTKPNARVACECAAANGIVMVMGETSASTLPNIDKIVRNTISKAGYDTRESGFDVANCTVITAMNRQSPDIAMGVVCSQETRMGDSGDQSVIGAGDQGMMFGFACDETPELMPLPIAMAHGLTRRLAQVRKDGKHAWLLPDGKSQVTIEYSQQGEPLRCEAVVVSAQHKADVNMKNLRRAIVEDVIVPEIPARLLDKETKIHINPTGRFVVGGPAADSGLTGRKIIADTYGGYAGHGGGSFSGKDPTKVDRTGAYMARYVAKNIVAAGLARRCAVQVAYAIGIARPVSVLIDSQGTGILPDHVLAVIVDQCFDFRPAGMIETLRLRRPIYRQVSCYGHFGRADGDIPWEETDMVSLLSAFKEITVG